MKKILTASIFLLLSCPYYSANATDDNPEPRTHASTTSAESCSNQSNEQPSLWKKAQTYWANLNWDDYSEEEKDDALIYMLGTILIASLYIGHK